MLTGIKIGTNVPLGLFFPGIVVATPGKEIDQSVSISLYEMLNNSFKIYTYSKGLLTMLNIYFFFYQVFLWSLPHYDSVGYIIQAQNGYYPFLVFWLR